MTVGMLAALGPVTLPACGGTLEDDYQRQQRAPNRQPTQPEGVSSPADAGAPTSIIRMSGTAAWRGPLVDRARPAGA